MRALVMLTALGALLGAVGCARKNVMERKVEAANAEAFAASRADFVAVLTPEQRAQFETALQELKLDAMHAGVAGVAQREEKMRVAIHGRTLAEAMVLGWRAREARLHRELTDMKERLARDSQLQGRATKPDSVQFFSNLIQNEQDLIAELERDIAETRDTLASLGASALPGPADTSGGQKAQAAEAP